MERVHASVIRRLESTSSGAPPTRDGSRDLTHAPPVPPDRSVVYTIPAPPPTGELGGHVVVGPGSAQHPSKIPRRHGAVPV